MSLVNEHPSEPNAATDTPALPRKSASIARRMLAKMSSVHEKDTQEREATDTIAANPEAKVARDYEENQSYWQTVCKYLPAIMWSITFAMSIVGEGYDLALMGNFFSLPQFKNLFGYSPDGGVKEIPAMWQSIILVCSQTGQVAAMWFAGVSMDRYGYRKTMIVSLASVMVFLLVNFFATDVMQTYNSYQAGLGMIVAGEFLLGMPWGSFQACVLAYASDISPMKLRPALTTFVSMCWIFGQLFSTAAIKTVSTIKNEVTAYRIPVALQWIWPLPVLICVFLAPESPWWLMRQSRSDLARQSLTKLNKDPTYPVDGQVKVLELTNEQEKRDQDTAHITYRDCFKGTNLRRTTIVVMTNVTQQLCGSTLMFYSAKLYQKAGMSVGKSLDFTLIQYALGIICIVLSWPLMNYVGRRTIWLYGLSATVVIMGGVGILGFFNDRHVSIPWLIAVLLVVFTGVYNLSIGPLVYAINPEIPSSRQKAKTLVLGRVAYLLAGQFNMWLVPRMLEDAPNGWGLGPRTGLVYSGISALFLLWSWFILPEVKGRTPAEMDELFKLNISARKFAETEIRG